MKNVWENMRLVFDPSSSQPESIEKTVEGDSFEAYLASLDETTNSVIDANICEDLENLAGLPRLKLKTSGSQPETILDHWLNMKSSKPELYRLATAFLGIPCTQVSVERSFSALALILTKQRTLLDEQTLADILLIRLNSELLKKVDFSKI